MSPRFGLKMGAAAGLLLAAVACQSGQQAPRVIGEAYAGPAALKIRADIPLESPTVATVRHGERLEIIQRRRRFLKVRTPSGALGWTDERQLLAASEMAGLRQLADWARKMPAQGQATSYGELNIHTQPARQSPSYFQVKENEKVDVLTHEVTPRTDLPRPPLLPPVEKKKPPAKPKKEKASKYPPPPMPKPPPPPENWLDLSKTEQDEEEAAPPETEPEEKPVPTDDWSLVRTRSGLAGWALTRRLMMAIPDEVAQYAEGHRIVSYFALGETMDGDQKKPIWLWTTVGSGPHPYDFDSIRVFVWSLRRHRYETAHVERNLQGYAPVLLQDVDFAAGSRAKGTPETTKSPGFSVCVEKSDGHRYRRAYALLGNVVRFAGEGECAVQPAPPMDLTVPGKAMAQAVPPAEAPKESLGQRLKNRWQALTRRWRKSGSGGTGQPQ